MSVEGVRVLAWGSGRERMVWSVPAAAVVL